MKIYDEYYERYMQDSCPSCGNNLDEVDYEYQICSVCNWSDHGIPMPDDLPTADEILEMVKAKENNE